MATNPVAPAPGADPTAAAGSAPEASDMSGGFVIELTVKPDGSMSVGVEPLAAEASEGGDASADGSSAPAEDESSQAVPNLPAAFKLIKEIVDHAGQMADAGAGQDEMSGGYSGTGM